MKFIIPLTALLFLFLLSCGEGFNRSLSDPEGNIQVQKIIAENYDAESEVYQFSLSTESLKHNLSTIRRVYKIQDVFFDDSYDAVGKRFNDPQKQSNISVKNLRPFKIDSIDVSIIPDKYQEAINILNEMDLYNEDKSYYLTHWTFKADNNGEIVSDFRIDYLVGSSKSGRRTTKTYDKFSFRVDADQKLTFVK